MRPWHRPSSPAQASQEFGASVSSCEQVFGVCEDETTGQIPAIESFLMVKSLKCGHTKPMRFPGPLLEPLSSVSSLVSTKQEMTCATLKRNEEVRQQEKVLNMDGPLGLYLVPFIRQ